MAAFLIGGRRLAGDDPLVARALAVAHARRERPRCLCTPVGVEMYVAKAGHGFVLKRMPYSGARHALSCRSHDWRITRPRPRTEVPRRTEPSQRSHGQDLALLGAEARLLGELLESLWQRAELSRWRPAFEGRRSWATVRRHLLRAAEKMHPNGSVTARLYVPEPFRVDAKDEIRARRLAFWHGAARKTGDAFRSLLLIGELKKIVPVREGLELLIRHVPDQLFHLDEVLCRWASRQFAAALDLWGTTPDLRLVVAASFTPRAGQAPRIECLHLMPVTTQWLPVRDGADLARVERLVAERHPFLIAPPCPAPQRTIENPPRGDPPHATPPPPLASPAPVNDGPPPAHASLHHC